MGFFPKPERNLPVLCLASIITSQEASCQPLVEEVEQAPTLARLVLTAWALGLFLGRCVTCKWLSQHRAFPLGASPN